MQDSNPFCGMSVAHKLEEEIRKMMGTVCVFMTSRKSPQNNADLFSVFLCPEVVRHVHRTSTHETRVTKSMSYAARGRRGRGRAGQAGEEKGGRGEGKQLSCHTKKTGRIRKANGHLGT